jgi:hypothetical protein
MRKFLHALRRILHKLCQSPRFSSPRWACGTNFLIQWYLKEFWRGPGWQFNGSSGLGSDRKFFPATKILPAFRRI